jgi:hypothetical protein
MAGKKQSKIRYTGIQPQYFPRLHYFARILSTDVFVIRDDCQYVNSHKYPDGSRGKSYQSHSPIKQSQGAFLLTVPVVHDGLESISETRIQTNIQWEVKHLKSIQTGYGRSQWFKQMHDDISLILKERYENLADLNIATICWGVLKILGERVSLEKLNIEYVNSLLKEQTKVRLKEIKKGSESQSLKNSKELTANGKILALIKEIGANEDYSGGTAVAAYVNKDVFEKNGISIAVQDWKCREYPQQYTAKTGFIPNLSIIDLLMNVSSSEALSILTS